MKLRAWTCIYCENQVSEIGAYAKLSGNKYAHLTCHTALIEEKNYERGRMAVLAEQEAERARERQSQEERQARERAMEERRAEVAERERTNRILAQREMPLPPRVDREEAARRAIAEGRSVTIGQEPERPKSRFELIEMDDAVEPKTEEKP